MQYTIIRIIQNKQTRRFILGQIIETVWTIASAIILAFIAIPSLRLLYLIDEIHNPVITLKAVGHQWYWSYEYSDFTKLEFDSYTVQQEDKKIDTFRLRPSRFTERRQLGRKGWGWHFVCIQLVYNFNFVIDPIPFKNKIPTVSPLICWICSGTV
jgi:heme/copper-type cytochrome/quinol oxidase subunit 2